MDEERPISLDKMSRQCRRQQEKTGSIVLDVDEDINLFIATLSTSIDTRSFMRSVHRRKMITSYLVTRSVTATSLMV